jgi:hypothetical protein
MQMPPKTKSGRFRQYINRKLDVLSPTTTSHGDTKLEIVPTNGSETKREEKYDIDGNQLSCSRPEGTSL